MNLKIKEFNDQTKTIVKGQIYILEHQTKLSDIRITSNIIDLTVLCQTDENRQPS